MNFFTSIQNKHEEDEEENLWEFTRKINKNEPQRGHQLCLKLLNHFSNEKFPENKFFCYLLQNESFYFCFRNNWGYLENFFGFELSEWCVGEFGDGVEGKFWSKTVQIIYGGIKNGSAL